MGSALVIGHVGLTSVSTKQISAILLFVIANIKTIGETQFNILLNQHSSQEISWVG